MQKLQAMIRKIEAKILHYFPERQIYLRTEQDVRLIRIGTRIQLMMTGTAVLIAGWLGIATIGMASSTDAWTEIAAREAELARMEAQVVAMKADVRNLKGDVLHTAEQLQQRQTFLASLLSGKGNLRQLAALMPKNVELTTADARDSEHASLLAPLAKIERQQLAFVDKATVAAEARYRDTQALLQRLGLSPTRFVGQSLIAMGGPLEPVDTKDNPLAGAEPKFKELFLSWKKLDQLEQAMVSVPSLKPVKSFSYTSSFGVRYDPFNGSAAMHAGVDMAGPVGEPIYASADGTVERAGWAGAYGNMIELSHGKGINTRYGHLSRILVQPGERIKQGQVIGQMGSTGRSTGSHLHYEVRIDGRAVNPMPFLQAGTAVLAMQNRQEEGQGGPASAK